MLREYEYYCQICLRVYRRGAVVIPSSKQLGRQVCILNRLSLLAFLHQDSNLPKKRAPTRRHSWPRSSCDMCPLVPSLLRCCLRESCGITSSSNRTISGFLKEIRSFSLLSTKYEKARKRQKKPGLVHSRSCTPNAAEGSSFIQLRERTSKRRRFLRSQ